MMFRIGVPNLLTLIRIFLIPVFILIFYLPFHKAHLTAAVIFALACLTDWFDGYLARKLKDISVFGAFFDPVADKLLVATSLLLLVGSGLNYIVLPAVVIVGREIVISALREWMAEMGNRASLNVNYIAKVKTSIQMLAIFLLIIGGTSGFWINILGTVLIYMASFLTIWSMMIYLNVAWPELIKKTERSG